MADRVHPSVSSPSPSPSPHPPPESTPNPPEKSLPPAGTYVIQIPKDQIFRHPSPDNARRYHKYTGQKPRRGRRCCCWFLSLAALLILLLAIASGIFYLVIRPEAPSYSVQDISITGFNVSSEPPISPGFNVTVRAENPNKKISIYYEKDSSVRVYHSDVNLCNGVLPAFHQPSRNVTVFQTKLKGSGIVLTSAVRETLLNQQRQGNIPLKLKLKAPVKIKVGSVKTWTITVKVSCDVTVDKLTAASKIVSNDCDFSVRLW